MVALTAWVATGLRWAQDRDLTPVLLTPGSAQLSPVLHHVAERGGCHWIRQGPGGMHDGITGRPATWDGDQFSPADGAAWEVAGSGAWDVVVECETLHPGGEGPRVGPFAAAIHHACGLAPPTSWGALEPTDRAWDTGALTEHARSTSPAPSRCFTRSPTGDGVSTVIPRPVGIAEQYVLHAPAEGLLPSQTDLHRLGERLLRTGSDLVVLGYRRPTLTPGGPLGRTGTLLPGVICFAPTRFEGLDPQSLSLAPDSGACAQRSAEAVILTFGAPARPGDEASVALITAWGHALRTLAEHDALRAADHGAAAPWTGRDRHGLHV